MRSTLDLTTYAKRVQQALFCGLLLAGTIVCLQISAYLAQLSEATAQLEARTVDLTEEVRTTMQNAQAVLSSVRGTTETVRKSAVEQMGYYEAAGRRGSAVLARLEILIARTDARMERITQALEGASESANESMAQVGALAASTRKDLGELAEQGRELMQASTESMELVSARLGDSRLDQIANSMATSTENAAEATANVAEASGYVRDMLSPTRKSFWRRLLELLLPRPTVNVP
jgi:ABC-type transporter Mla subunit MlaD